MQLLTDNQLENGFAFSLDSSSGGACVSLPNTSTGVRRSLEFVDSALGASKSAATTRIETTLPLHSPTSPFSPLGVTAASVQTQLGIATQSLSGPSAGATDFPMDVPRLPHGHGPFDTSTASM